MHAMLERDTPEDYVIATGTTFSLEQFVAEVFAAVGLDWRRHVTHDASLARPSELGCGRADPSLAAERLGWQAKSSMPDVARMMVEARRGSQATMRRVAA
jgi:GDPmannose 4,6-dehydratase